MSFEQLGRQFTNLLITDRDQPGFYDPMFKEDVDMRPLLRYKEAVDAEIADGTFGE